MQHSGLNTETSYFVDENDQRHSKNVLKVAVERGGAKSGNFRQTAANATENN